MSDQAAIKALVETLAAAHPYQSPLTPVYEALFTSINSRESLTLRAIGTQSQLLRDCADLADEQDISLHQVISSCKQCPPIPLPALPFGF